MRKRPNVDGIPLVLVDTAGIRTQTADEVERIGVERSQAALGRADIALMVVDGSCELENGDREIEKLVQHKPGLLVINKTDLQITRQFEPPPGFYAGSPRVRISALAGEGISELETAISELVLGGHVTMADTPMVSNPRHKALIQSALEHTQGAVVGQQNGLTPDLVSIDVREAVEALGEITGETVTEDLLDTIFSQILYRKMSFNCGGRIKTWDRLLSAMRTFSSTLSSFASWGSCWRAA